MAGEDFSLTWTFKNTGSTAWSPDVHLKRVHGDDEIKSATNIIGKSIQPDEEAELTIDFKAPFRAGVYNSFFRLVHNNNVEFGDKVWIDLKVNEAPVTAPPVQISKPVKELKVIEKKVSFDPMLRSQQMLNKFEASDDRLDKSMEVPVAKSASSGEFEVQADQDKEDHDSNIIVV